MIVWATFSLLFFLLFNKDHLYAFSSVLPQKVRRSWIKMRHGDDYLRWDEFSQILENHFPYFRMLNDREKSEFLVRLTDFKNRMPVEAREGLDLDTKKLVLLHASLTQITFGYDDFRF